jgi:branched-subunit amino acid ABC-type transport system permease component
VDGSHAPVPDQHLNGLSAGLLLFMRSAGLMLIFSMLGLLISAHARFYLLGAYLAHAVSAVAGFWPALLLAPLAVGLKGASFERSMLRRAYRAGRVDQMGPADQADHLPQLLITFGLSCVVLEAVQLVWGRAVLHCNSSRLRCCRAQPSPWYGALALACRWCRVRPLTRSAKAHAARACQ